MANVFNTSSLVLAVFVLSLGVSYVVGAGLAGFCPIMTTGDKVGGSSKYIGQGWSKTLCIEECQKRSSEYKYNGISMRYTSYGDYCYCDSGVWSTNEDSEYGSCMFRPECPAFSLGEGKNADDKIDRISMGELSDEECFIQCQLHSDKAINGISMYDQGCYCERRMVSSDGSDWRMCFFPDKPCGLDCGGHGSCVHTFSGQKCVCVKGWIGNDCRTPVCDKECGNYGKCIAPNECKCAVGWTGPQCKTNINECLHNKGGCAHTCIDNDGSFECRCKSAYTLNADGRNCDEKRFTVVVNIPKDWKKNRRRRELNIPVNDEL